MVKWPSIGEVAKATGIKVVTLRYYEQLGLVPAPARTAGNYRAYSENDLRRLRFIRRCRDLGFTLDQVRELLRLSSQKNQECSEVDRITRRHLTDVEAKIADLKRLSKVLRRISSRCRGDGLIADCRIIEALSPESSTEEEVVSRNRNR
jgi:Cu(I)-responsive transcriptional regulator